MDIRIGQGIDFHRLEEELDLWIGGIKIPSRKGAVAHSDGDVLIHAICDAILGAAGLKDIGHHFPDTDERFKNIDSRKLLVQTLELIGKMGFRLVNIDSTVCLEEPKINPHIDSIKKSLSGVTGLEEGRIGVKATTTEKMGFTGRGEGISALASVLISAV
ncbi:MAG: 2-C-methyl-D-erythritol 2,4-cyclodiphosphate synthase [Marinilabiliaceae bacterium]|jgi:2-C-methyl-D-erythritol 2,4-cyclodiphosphate synthase|nr:2-C-methyl-D-erythritol 2,4-cyclodiphosphate synthase [Marinilabiliaceae bacterium]